jgi:hypothetical protein
MRVRGNFTDVLTFFPEDYRLVSSNLVPSRRSVVMW